MSISIADLRYVTVACPNCRTKVSIDMQDPAGLTKTRSFLCPTECPVCQIRYDSALAKSVDSLQRLYEKLAAISDLITFSGEPRPES